MAESAAFQRGEQAGRAATTVDTSRVVLDLAADHLEACRGRLAHMPEAVSALNEATAILRDAALDHAQSRQQEFVDRIVGAEQADVAEAKKKRAPARKKAAASS